MKTKNLTLIPNVPAHLVALTSSATEYEKASSMRVADGAREFLLAASPEFLEQLQGASAPDPWRFGFAILHTTEKLMIGLCGFTGRPAPDGVVEIAYGVAPVYEGRGFATEAASALVDFASASGRVKKVCAHTLPEINASTRVLEKCGFIKVGELIDPENNLVWRWEKML